MQNHYLSCRKPTDNIGPRKLIMANKVLDKLQNVLHV